MITKKKRYLNNLFILTLGVITSFSLPPYNYWFINFLTFSLLYIILYKNKNEGFKFFFIYGYTFGFGYFASSLYWISYSLSFDNNFKFLIPFTVILIPLLISFFFGIGFLIFKFFINSKNFINILVFSLILGLIEFIRGSIFSGFPWNLFAYSLSENIRFIQITSITGLYGFNTILITIFTLPSLLFLKRFKTDVFGFIFIIILFVTIYIYGFIRVNEIKNLQTEILPLEIKILSTKIPIERFYSSLDNEEIIKKLINLSNPIENQETIFIWPEGVIPGMNLASFKFEYDYLFNKYFSEKHLIILGINDEEVKKDKYLFYNSLSIIDNEANTIYKYYKNRLVPFGEFLPLEKYLKKIGLKTLTNNYQSYSPSSERKIYEYSNNSKIKILPLICYEIIYSGKISNNNDYNFIVNISEDGWFGNSIGPYQHFAHSIFRSVEYGKYTLRSANNGISAIIDPSGLIIDKLNISKEGGISINRIKNVDKTFFSTYGNKSYYLIILLYIFLIFSFKKLDNE